MKRFMCGYDTKEFAAEINSYTDDQLIYAIENGEDYDNVYTRELIYRASLIDSTVEEEFDKVTDSGYTTFDVDAFMTKVFAILTSK